MVYLMAEAPCSEAFSFYLEPAAVSVLRMNTDLLRPFYQTVLLRNTKAAFGTALFTLRKDNFRIDKLNEIRFLSFRNIGFKYENCSPQSPYLRCGEANAVGGAKECNSFDFKFDLF